MTLRLLPTHIQSVPAAGIAGAVLVWSFPKDNMDFGKSVFKRIDFIGSLLSIGSAVLLLYGLQTGGAEHPWSDSRIVGTIVAGGVAVVLFFLYEWFIQRHSSAVIEPVMPFRLFKIPRVTFLLLYDSCSESPLTWHARKVPDKDAALPFSRAPYFMRS